MKNKKLLIILGSLGRGGAERVISIISNYFSDKGWDVTIALLLSNKVEYEINENVKIVDLSGKTESRIKRLPGWIFSIRKLVKNENPDIILSFAARINVITQFSCIGLNQKIVVSERNDPYCDGRSKLIDIMTKLLYPKARAVVFQTKRAKSYFNNLNNSTIIVNPITVSSKAAEPKKGKVVTVGRLAPQKNQSLLIKAFSDVLKELPYAELFIYGEGNLKGELQKIIKELKLSDNIHFMGNVLNIHEHIADAEVFVLSSDYEGLSNALLEALMMGLPCISTNCAGSDECIVPNENGVLVNIGDKEALASSIIEILKNRKKAKDLAEESKKRAKNFEKEIVLEQWYNLLDITSETRRKNK